MDKTQLIPVRRREKGGKARLPVAYMGRGGIYLKQPIMLPAWEKMRLHKEAIRRGVSMAALVRLAVVDLAREVFGDGADIGAMARELGVPAEALADLASNGMVRFKPDLQRLARSRGISMSHAARWALNVLFAR